MRKGQTIISFLCLALVVLLAGCYQPGGPVPEGAHAPVPRDYTQEQVDAAVVMDEQAIAAPLPDEWKAPEACDEIHFLRFRLRDGSTLGEGNPLEVNSDTTDAMLIMIPGVLSGANCFEYMARQLVYMAKVQDGKNVEVWAVERRTNRLEDVNGFNYIERALKSGSMTLDEAVDTVIGYYYEGQPLEGKTFDGWYGSQDDCLSEFGLKLATEDVFEVIETMVPDPEVRRQKLFVGGHSMGGMMTSMFAGWDLDGDPATLDDAGYNNCAGIFGLDTVITPVTDIIETFTGFLPKSIYEQLANMTEPVYAGLIDGLRNGSLPRILNSPPLMDAELMALLELVGLAVRFEPDSECTLIREVPYSASDELMLRIMHTCDMQTFLAGKPELRDYRYTNEALLGMFFDDDMAPIGMVQTSMGFLQGGPVVKKDFPRPGVLLNIPVLSDFMNVAFGPQQSYIANDAGPIENLGTGPLYSWVNFDEIGDASDPNYQDQGQTITYTTMDNEVSDIRDLARAVCEGPQNLAEWYFSDRLVVDFMGAVLPYGPKYGLNFLHADRLKDLPQTIFMGDQSPLSGPALRSIILPGGHDLIKGYNHLDILFASANTSARRPNEVIRPLIDFALENTK